MYPVKGVCIYFLRNEVFLLIYWSWILIRLMQKWFSSLDVNLYLNLACEWLVPLLLHLYLLSMSNIIQNFFATVLCFDDIFSCIEIPIYQLFSLCIDFHHHIYASAFILQFIDRSYCYFIDMIIIFLGVDS